MLDEIHSLLALLRRVLEVTAPDMANSASYMGVPRSNPKAPATSYTLSKSSRFINYLQLDSLDILHRPE